MCGRARLSSDVSEIKIVFSIPPERPTPNFPPSWNVAPTDPLPVVRFDPKAGQRSLDLMRWGLVPNWAKDIKVGFANINAKPKASKPSPLFAKPSSGVAALCRWTTSMSGRKPRPANSPMRSRSRAAASWRSRVCGRTGIRRPASGYAASPSSLPRQNSTATACMRALDHGAVRLLTRTGLDWTHKYPAISAGVASLLATQAYLDGELCGVRADGVTSFSMIQAASDSGNAAALLFFLFDLLYLDSEDLCARPLRWRGLKSSPGRNDGVVGSGRLLPRAWRRERWSRRSRGGRRFAPDRSITDLLESNLRTHRRPAIADLSRAGAHRARDHLLLRSPHNPFRLGRVALAPVIAAVILALVAGPLVAREYRSRERYRA
jgi:hypothetical protein